MHIAYGVFLLSSYEDLENTLSGAKAAAPLVEPLPSMYTKPWVWSQTSHKTGRDDHSWHRGPGIDKVATGGLGVCKVIFFFF